MNSFAGNGPPQLPGHLPQPGGRAWPPVTPGPHPGGMAQALLTAPGASLYAVLADLAGVPDGDLVVVRFERLPAFLGGDVAGRAAEVSGGYGVVTGADLSRHVVG